MAKAGDNSGTTLKAPTPTIERAEIDSGLTGEKVTGFDPATAPMETDAEAGGVASIATPEPLPAAKSDANDNATSGASAMRQPDKGYSAESRASFRFAGTMAFFFAIVIVGAALAYYAIIL